MQRLPAWQLHHAKAEVAEDEKTYVAENEKAQRGGWVVRPPAALDLHDEVGAQGTLRWNAPSCCLQANLTRT